jgi:hypothetical protein
VHENTPPTTTPTVSQLSSPLLPEERCRYNGDTVRTTVRVWTGVDDDGIEKIITELVAEPMQVFDVCLRPLCVHASRERHE